MKENIKLPIDKLRRWAEETPDAIALHEKEGNGWKDYSWREYHGRVEQVAKALVAVGIKKGECVNIISNNRVEWLFSQFGIMAAGGVATPSFQTNTSEQLAYIVNHSEARLIFAENSEQYRKLEECKTELPGLERVVLFDPVPDADSEWAIGFEDFLDLGTEVKDLKQRTRSIRPDDNAFIIYTSGTTGKPKAVMTTHFHISYMGETLLRRFPMDVRSRAVSYLPLSHIAEQIATNNLQLEKGGEVFMCRDFLLLKDYLQEVRPNVMLGVPHVWEKVETALKGIINSSRSPMKQLFRWALEVELQSFDREERSNEKVSSLKRRLANKMIIDKIKQKLGMDRVLHAFAGAAPSNPDNLRFFASLGIRINEVYGMTETTGILSTTSPSNRAFGTVGKPMEGVEIRIADDGEVLAQGPALSKGYLHDDKASSELWEGGWLHTGDIGEFDVQGNLKITDRKKDLIITAGGKNVAPQPIEAMLKRIDGISQAVVVGDKRPYLIALLTIDPVSVVPVAERLGILPDETDNLDKNDRFIEFISSEMKKVNQRNAHYQAIGRFRLLQADFSIEGGELTPTMKVKRKVVNKKYSDQISAIYDENG